MATVTTIDARSMYPSEYFLDSMGATLFLVSMGGERAELILGHLGL